MRRELCVFNTTSSTRVNWSIDVFGLNFVQVFSYGSDVRNIANFPSNRFAGSTPFYCLEFSHAKYEILPIPRADKVTVLSVQKKKKSM